MDMSTIQLLKAKLTDFHHFGHWGIMGHDPIAIMMWLHFRITMTNF